MKGELERVTIESAENGFMLSCQYAPGKAKKGKKGEPSMPVWVEPERYVYETPAAVLKKVGSVLGGLRKAKGGASLAQVGMNG